MNPFASLKSALKGTAASPFVHVERDLVEKFGLTHDTVKDARAEHLQRGTDWELVKGLVQYSDAGLAKISAALHVPPAATTSPADPALVVADSPPNTDPATPPAEKNPLNSPVHGELRDLVCVRRVPNRRAVLARTESGAAAWVRVSDSINFRPGMIMPARFLERDQWELARKAPRHPGKW